LAISVSVGENWLAIGTMPEYMDMLRGFFERMYTSRLAAKFNLRFLATARFFGRRILPKGALERRFKGKRQVEKLKMKLRVGVVEGLSHFILCTMP
jgi:hypothetical protein